MNPQPCTLRGAPQAAPLLYGSVCSGIEAVSLAWQPLGLKAAWFAEIEPFPSAVLAHRYPHVPNLGDMTAIARQVSAGTVPAPNHRTKIGTTATLGMDDIPTSSG